MAAKDESTKLSEDEFIELYINLDESDRILVNEFLDALIAGDMAKCDRMMREAQSRQEASAR